jgi:P-type Mg2+ transporter
MTAPVSAVSIPAMVPAADRGVGLSSKEAAERIRRYGPNDPAPRRRSTLVTELLLLLVNPLVIILLIASLLSLVLGQHADAGIIFAIAMSSVAINFVQTYRSSRAIEALRLHVSLTATVIRDGTWQAVNRDGIVPGDVVRLAAGDLVPADGILLESRDLYVQQGALTGESMPVEKNATLSGDETQTGPAARNLLFLGTSIVSGTGLLETLQTGRNTAFGAISVKLRERAGETEFERALKQFGFLILRVVLFLILFILVVRVALHRDAFESFVFAVALAVGLTPEFLPMITSVTLARGAVRMARESVIVKHLPAIQNFGSIDILCSDKTGTLTLGTMTFAHSLNPAGERSSEPLRLAYLNSKFESGIRSPLDSAILQTEGVASDSFEKCDELPFDFNRRRVSVVLKPLGSTGAEDRGLLITKGAPEGIWSLCNRFGSDGATSDFDAVARIKSRDVFDELCRHGYRVLAVASREVPLNRSFTQADESDLVFAGYLAFSDPPNSDVTTSLAHLKRDGVEVKILTGDNELVAQHICTQVGFPRVKVVLGNEIDGMTDPALGHVAEEANVFARVTPMQKLRILRALRQRGHVVGFLGDGINDAPALHSADVGISVASAVDVARDAADIILQKPGLKVLHRGILEGRRASGNVLKYLLMDTSSNFGNMFSMAGASLFLPFLPMLSTQILLNNFLYDSAQIMIPTDNVDAAYLRKPQRWDMKFIRDFMIFIGPISSLYDFLTFYVLLHFFHASEKLFHTGWFVESLATQTLVVFVIRTAGRPWRSKPSGWLTLNTLAIVAIAVALPFSPLSALLGFTPPPLPFFAFLVFSSLTYLLLVEIAKRIFFAHASARSAAVGKATS